MTVLAPTLEAFFTDRLAQQRRASAHTVAAYRDSFRLLLGYLQHRTGKAPSRLQLEDLDAELITVFLAHLKDDRANSVRTRNAGSPRWTRSSVSPCCATHSTHGSSSGSSPSPTSGAGKGIVPFLTEVGGRGPPRRPRPLNASGDETTTWLVLALQTGLRVSELTGLCCGDVELGTGAHIRTRGKGRKDRCTPLTAHTVAVLGTWMREHDRQPTDPIFPGRGNVTLSADAVQRMIAKHTATAATHCPTCEATGHGSCPAPHGRHDPARRRSRPDRHRARLGHERVETTDIYIHGDLTIKERAIARTAPPGTRPGRYKPPDPLLAFLEGS